MEQQEQDELDELPGVVWRAKVSPSMDRRQQLDLYQRALGPEAARRQVLVHRQAQARRKRKP